MTLCASCATPLILILDAAPSSYSDPSSASAPSSIPDDVTLHCGCHFHWQCLVDGYTGRGQCPRCHDEIRSPNASTIADAAFMSNHERILVTLHNEGGLQGNLDIEPLLREEVYLKDHPAEKQARAFLEFVRERDVDAIAQVLRDAAGLLQDSLDSEDLGSRGIRDVDVDVDLDDGDAMDEDGDADGDEDEDEDETPQLPLPALLRYQDPLDQQRSALHITVSAGDKMVVWVLLLLASRLSLVAFPQNIRQIVGQMGFAREDQDGLSDIRSLRDATGRTAWDLVTGGMVERKMMGFDVELLTPP